MTETGALAGALAKAQGEFAPVTRDREVTVSLKTGGSYKFKYAPLDTVLAAVRKALSDNGIALVQELDGQDLVTSLLHSSGESRTSRLPIPVNPGETIQQFGSAVTYLRRYTIQAVLGIAAEEDDDGNAHAGNQATGRDRATVAVERQGFLPRGETVMPKDGLFGNAEAGKNDADFEMRQTPDGPRVAFALVDGKTKWKVEAYGVLAELITANRVMIEDFRVQAWGDLRDVADPPTATGFVRRYQVLTLSRLKVGPLDLSEPEQDDDEPPTLELVGP